MLCICGGLNNENMKIKAIYIKNLKMSEGIVADFKNIFYYGNEFNRTKLQSS